MTAEEDRKGMAAANARLQGRNGKGGLAGMLFVYSLIPAVMLVRRKMRS